MSFFLTGKLKSEKFSLPPTLRGEKIHRPEVERVWGILDYPPLYNPTVRGSDPSTNEDSLEFPDPRAARSIPLNSYQLLRPEGLNSFDGSLVMRNLKLK